MDLRIFKSFRVRLENAEGGSSAAGFVTQTDDNLVTIQLSSQKGIEAGDKVTGSVVIHHKEVTFNAVVKCACPHELQFQISGPLLIKVSKQDARRAVDENIAVYFGNEKLEAVAVDLSLQGIGLRSNVAFDIGMAVRFEIPFGGTTIKLKGNVVYSKPMQKGKWNKSGVTLDLTKRADRLQYVKYLQATDPLAAIVRQDNAA